MLFRSKSYLHSGTSFADPLRPQPKEIHIADIAQGLTNESRFAGQRFISVAEHSLEVTKYTQILGGSPQDCLYALLHDAAEAYLGDLPSWVKKHCADYRKFERRYIKAIMTRFGLPIKMPSMVKEADDWALTVETAKYFDCNSIEGRDHIRTKSRFLDRFNNLYWTHLQEVK